MDKYKTRKKIFVIAYYIETILLVLSMITLFGLCGRHELDMSLPAYWGPLYMGINFIIMISLYKLNVPMEEIAEKIKKEKIWGCTGFDKGMKQR